MIGAMSEEVSNKLAEAAVGPKRVRTDAGEVESHDLDQIIEADKYLASKAAASSANRGLRFNRLEPRGTI